MFSKCTNRESDDFGSEGSFEEPDNDLINEPEKEYIDENDVFDEYCNDISADLEPDNTLTFETTAPRHNIMLALVKWICLFLLHLLKQRIVSPMQLSIAFFDFFLLCSEFWHPSVIS